MDGGGIALDSRESGRILGMVRSLVKQRGQCYEGFTNQEVVEHGQDAYHGQDGCTVRPPPGTRGKGTMDGLSLDCNCNCIVLITEYQVVVLTYLCFICS